MKDCRDNLQLFAFFVAAAVLAQYIASAIIWFFAVYGGFMTLPLFTILAAVILIALVFWVMRELAVDAMIQKVVRIVVVAVFIIWLAGILLGHPIIFN